MTAKTDATVARLEAVLDRLERLGLAPPEIDPRAAVDPDGYPGAVVSGELIEAAWGNAVVDKLHAHADSTQIGSTVGGPYSANSYRVIFAEPFPVGTTPIVLFANGDIAATAGYVVFGLESVDNEKFQVAAATIAGTNYTGTLRLNWIAHVPL